MTACTRTITKDADEDVAMRRVEDAEDMENVDVDVANKIWEGDYFHTHGNCVHLGSACRTPVPTH